MLRRRLPGLLSLPCLLGLLCLLPVLAVTLAGCAQRALRARCDYIEDVCRLECQGPS